MLHYIIEKNSRRTTGRIIEKGTRKKRKIETKSFKK
jgi:hypothetical protein